MAWVDHNRKGAVLKLSCVTVVMVFVCSHYIRASPLLKTGSTLIF